MFWDFFIRREKERERESEGEGEDGILEVLL